MEQWFEYAQQAPWVVIAFALAYVFWKLIRWFGAKGNDLYDLMFDKEDGRFIKMFDHQNEFTQSVKDNNLEIREDIGASYELIKSIERKVTAMGQVGLDNLNSDYFSVLFEHSELPTAFVDADYSFMSGNAKFTELLGYTNDELRQMSIKDVSLESDMNLDLAQAERTRDGEIDFYRMEKTFVRKDKTHVYCTMFMYRIPSEGPIRHFIKTLVPARGVL